MILLALSLIAAVIVMGNGLFFVINRMSRQTAHSIRIAWILMTTGALGVLVGVLSGRWQPAFCDSVLLVGLALYMVFERRRSVQSWSEK